LEEPLRKAFMCYLFLATVQELIIPAPRREHPGDVIPRLAEKRDWYLTAAGCDLLFGADTLQLYEVL